MTRRWGNGFHSSLAAESRGSGGPGTTSEVWGAGIMGPGGAGPGDAGLPPGGQGCGVSAGEKGQRQHLAAEKFTRKEKRARGREKPNKEEQNNEERRALAGRSAPASPQVAFGSAFFRGSSPSWSACPRREPVESREEAAGPTLRWARGCAVRACIVIGRAAGCTALCQAGGSYFLDLWHL